MKRRRYLPLLILALSLGSAHAATRQTPSRPPLVISLGTHSLTFPWHPEQVTRRLNPALMVGTERTLRPGRRVRLYQTANLGLFQHYWWMTAAFLNTEMGSSFALPLGIRTDLRLGIGYLHYFWRRQLLELRDGVYAPVTDWGKPSLMIPLSLELGYRKKPSRPHAQTIEPFVAVQWIAQGLFLDEIPALPHLLVLVGARIPMERVNPAGGS